MRLNLLQPVLDIVKCRLLGAIVDENDAHCALIICLSDCAEAFLPGSVPHLQLDALVLHINRLYLEVDTWNTYTKQV